MLASIVNFGKYSRTKASILTTRGYWGWLSCWTNPPKLMMISILSTLSSKTIPKKKSRS